jgi:hypothetical protein
MAPKYKAPEPAQESAMPEVFTKVGNYFSHGSGTRDVIATAGDGSMLVGAAITPWLMPVGAFMLGAGLLMRGIAYGMDRKGVYSGRIDQA